MNISIALATHNGRKYLEKQLDSLLQQTLLPREIVISDDGSTDGTWDLLHQYAQKNNIIKVLQTNSSGINENFQNALSVCRGECIAFCDQDDIWEENKLARISAGFSNGALLAYGKSILIDGDDRPLPVGSEKYLGFDRCPAGHLPYYFIFSNCISGHTIMIRKSLADSALPFPKNCMYDHWLALVASGKSDIVHIQEAITYHRIHSSNATNNQEKNRERKRQQPKSLKQKKFADQRAAILLRFKKALSDGDALSPAERDYLSQLSRQVAQTENSYFRLQLFLLLYRQRHHLFHGNLLRECRNRALGGRYYNFLDSFSALLRKS